MGCLYSDARWYWSQRGTTFVDLVFQQADKNGRMNLDPGGHQMNQPS